MQRRSDTKVRHACAYLGVRGRIVQKGIGEPHVFLLTCASWAEPTGSVFYPCVHPFLLEWLITNSSPYKNEENKQCILISIHVHVGSPHENSSLKKKHRIDSHLLARAMHCRHLWPLAIVKDQYFHLVYQHALNWSSKVARSNGRKNMLGSETSEHYQYMKKIGLPNFVY